jgi:inward rectifier potassium channel
MRAGKHRRSKRKPRPRRALVQRPGMALPVVRLNRERQWRDVYHRLLTLTWPRFFLVVAAWYVAINIGFALLYLLEPGAIGGGREPDRFEDAFFFSVQTIATIGYGVLNPATLYANLVMTVETVSGLIVFAVVTGLVFARLSRPTARILFSDVAVVTRHNGMPTLMFRCANQRLNQILEAHVSVNVLRDEVSAEGRKLRRFHTLPLIRDNTPVFALSWTVMHPLDETSPLHGLTHQDMLDEGLEVIVVIGGVDETFVQPIQARHSYLATEILWDHGFSDVLLELDDGRPAIDYDRFHDTHPDAPDGATPG